MSSETNHFKRGKKEEAVVLTEKAIGTFKDPVTGQWMVAEIGFNPLTGDVGEVVKHDPGGPGRDFAIEKFKLLAVETGIVG